jgi:spermidine/putrescine ABC transporter ATP-binding subunit
VSEPDVTTGRQPTTASGDVIVVEHVVKEFGTVRALDDVSLAIRENEFFALLGPSGCGKTTLLRSLGGFEHVTSGRILLDGRDLVGTRPYDRPVNMMFQSYALFPHMRVWDNVAYGLRAERLAKDEVRRRVDEVLGSVGLEELADRRPHQLSGGQRQRVALARAIVKRPRVLLLDEPLAALDRKLRGEMQIELKRLQHEVGITFIVVTHDQEEALTMADRVAVMHAGRILQVGTPVELYDRPASHFVAAFIGRMNFLHGVVADGRVEVLPGVAIRISSTAVADGSVVSVGIRPEAARLLWPGDAAGAGEVCLGGAVEAVAFVGSQVHTHLRLDGGDVPFVVTSVKRERLPTVGESMRVAWSIDHARILEG